MRISAYNIRATSSSNSPFLQEAFSIDHVFTNGTSLPCPIWARRIDLVKRRTANIIVTNYQQRNTKWTNTSAIWHLISYHEQFCVFYQDRILPSVSVILHHTSQLLNQDSCWWVLHVQLFILLSILSRTTDKQSKVWSHAWVYHAYAIANHGHLFYWWVVNERWSRLLFCGNDNTVGC